MSHHQLFSSKEDRFVSFQRDDPPVGGEAVFAGVYEAVAQHLGVRLDLAIGPLLFVWPLEPWSASPHLRTVGFINRNQLERLTCFARDISKEFCFIQSRLGKKVKHSCPKTNFSSFV